MENQTRVLVGPFGLRWPLNVAPGHLIDAVGPRLELLLAAGLEPPSQVTYTGSEASFQLYAASAVALLLSVEESLARAFVRLTTAKAILSPEALEIWQTREGVNSRLPTCIV